MTMRKGLPAKLALTDADDTRYDFRNLVLCNADGSVRPGVTSPVAVDILSGTATMALNVAAFSAIAKRDNGAILLANDGTVSVTVPTAPASNSVIHVIAARQDDASSTVSAPDADNIAKVYLIPGAPAVTPVAPAVPDGSVSLGTIQVNAGVTNTNGAVIKQVDAWTAGAGGIPSFRTPTALGLWTNPKPQQLAAVVADSTASNNGIYIWNGAIWAFYSKNAHAELVFTRAAAADGLNNFWSTVVDATKTNDSTLVAALTATGVTFTLTKPGVYVIEGAASIAAATTGRSYVDFTTTPDGNLGRTGVSAPENVLSVTVILVVGSAGVAVTPAIYKLTGGAADLTLRIKISRLGDF